MTKKKTKTAKISQNHMYYVGYDDNDKIAPLLMNLPHLIGYYKIFKRGKVMKFIYDKEKLFKKYKEI